MEKNWIIKDTEPSLRNALAGELGISDITAQVLINRGISTPDKAHDFLNPSLLNLENPFLMKGMNKAVKRIRKAASKGERIVVHGDYDVDGICATALVKILLKGMGADVSHYIPDRLQEGFGVNENAVRFAIRKKASVFITVDCGIAAFRQVENLNRAGIDVIITDHHQPSEDLPDAFCILNPLQKGCRYPYKDLAGVGIAFKLACALCGVDSDEVYEHLDLVCLGTVADVVPLTGENRILVKNGLEQLTNTKKKGLQSLVEVASLKGKDMNSHYVGYILGPRINAAGRLSSAESAMRLLMSDNIDESRKLARDLDIENRNRQKLEQRTLLEAMTKVEQRMDFRQDRVIVLHDDEWHLGVIGIVASRLVDKYHRPALVLSTKGNKAKGSGRSIKNFHLLKALRQCRHLLDDFGGHSYAAGVTIHKRKLGEFKKAMNSVARKALSAEDLIPTIEIDAEMPLSRLGNKLFSEIDELAPFGLGNPKPVFATRGLRLRTVPRVIGRDTLKMWVTDGKKTCEAIGFRMADMISPKLEDSQLDLAYACDLNTFRGVTSIQLKLKDLRIKRELSTAPVSYP